MNLAVFGETAIVKEPVLFLSAGHASVCSPPFAYNHSNESVNLLRHRPLFISLANINLTIKRGRLNEVDNSYQEIGLK